VWCLYFFCFDVFVWMLLPAIYVGTSRHFLRSSVDGQLVRTGHDNRQHTTATTQTNYSLQNTTMADQQRKQPRKILTEEDYTSTLTHIVTRDYFPSIYSLRRDAAILEARSRGDVASAVAIRREARREEMERERELMEDQAEEMEAFSNETAVAHLSKNLVIGTRKRPRPLKHESISGFHARVTSEDNAEFESNQEIESRQRELNLGIIYSSAADKSGRLVIEAAVNGKELPEGTNQRALMGCETPLGLASDLYNASPSAGLRITGNEAKTTSGIGRNGLFFQPQHNNEQTQTQTNHLMLEASTTAASSTGNFLALTSHEPTNDNILMPPPPARKSDTLCITETASQHANKTNQPLHTYQLVEYQPKPLVPHINPPATRFPNQAESRLLTTSNNNRGRHNFDGDTSEATTDLDEIPPSLDDERAARRAAVMREHETFVPMTPLIQPGRGDRTAVVGAFDEPIMTWGNVASTPLVLGNGMAVDRGNNPAADWEPTEPSISYTNAQIGEGIEFDVVEENSREKLAHRAEKKLNERAKTYRSAGSKTLLNKDSKTAALDDASIASSATSMTTATASYDRSASLTPAARALFEANTKAINSTSRSHSKSLSSKSRIFQPSPVSSTGLSAASRNSFGSALRMAYTPSSAPAIKKKTGRERNSVISSSLRRAAEGGTPRVTK
jgi:protein DGCR14